ncbi:MAG TPA: 2Fe-2S iron-sulfur cluster-binding protein [Myxococcales bacterium]|nr:2Fe-2S iron-sulfur cluster-binding protein [Myxococcales bacterium]
MTEGPAKKVKIFVDGAEVEADARDNLIEAARRVGVSIPYFCYHPRLSIAGQCRMCLVETSDAPGRLVPGCQVRVKEGLKIVTNSPAVKDNQRGCMEFHLVNHPVDCAICDQSGECKLQDYYMEYDHQPSRIRVAKLNKPKREIFGPLVVYDAERCIMCTRCVRFMDEIAQKPQLAVVQRGTYSLIATFPGQPLDSQYAGNTVDICPVGALLNRDFRFQSRIWFVNKSPSVCTGCSNGCNVYVEGRGNVVYRLLPRRNEEVNQVWMCDQGRLTYHATNERRVQWARTGRGENAASVGPRIALERAAELLRPLAGQGSVGIALSAQCTNEEAAAAFQIGAQLRASRYFLGSQPAGDSDDFLIRADKNPNSRGVRLVAEAFGVKLEDAEAVDGVKALVAMRTDGLPAGKLARMEVFVAIAQNEDAASAEADVNLPCESVYEQDGTLINWYGRLQRTWDSLPAPVGDAAPGWSWAKRLLDGLGGVGPTSAAEAFRTLAAKSPHLEGLTFEALPEDGIVLEALLPKEWPARAPRPLPGAHSIRGPRPPAVKVGDEASGGSR